MKLALLLTLLASFAASETSAASAEDALRHVFAALDENKDGSLSKSDYGSLEQTLSNTQGGSSIGLFFG